MPANYWVVRADGGRYSEDFRNKGFVGIGWAEMGDLTRVSDMDQLRHLVEMEYRGSPQSIGQAAGMMWNFAKEFAIDDIVLAPDPSRGTVLIGRIIGAYEYKPSWDDTCRYLHRRAVEWLAEPERANIREPVRSSLGSMLTVFNVSRHAELIEELITDTPPPPPGYVLPPKLRGEILSRLRRMEPYEFEDFVAHVLRVMGFEADTTSRTKDGGVDITGILHVGSTIEVEFVQIPLKVQVKRTGSVGRNVITLLRGNLDLGEIGAVFTTGKFPESTRKEAEEATRQNIFLVDGEKLVDIVLGILEKYDDKHIKDLLGIQRLFVART